MRKYNNTTREEKKHETYERILNSAIFHFGHEGYANTSISKIAKDAGVATGLVNTYFGSKENLLTQSYIHTVKETIPLPEKKLTSQEFLDHFIICASKSAYEKPDYFTFMITVLNTRDLPQDFNDSLEDFYNQAPVKDVVEKVQKEGIIPACDPYLLFSSFMLMLYNQLGTMKRISNLTGIDKDAFINMVSRIARVSVISGENT